MMQPSPPPVLVLAAGCLFSSDALASSHVHMTLTELAQQADAIFVGTLDEQISGVALRDGIVSHHHFTDIRWLKGGDAGSEVVLQVCGGQVGDLLVYSPGGPTLEPGGRYLLFVDDHLRTCWPFAGGWQGVFLVVESRDGNEALIDGLGRVVVRLSNGIVTARPYLPRQPSPAEKQRVVPVQGQALGLDSLREHLGWLLAAGIEDTGVRPTFDLEFGRLVEIGDQP